MTRKHDSRPNKDFIEISLSYKKPISVKLELDFIKRVDEMTKKWNFPNRSTFIRAALAFFMKVLELNGMEGIEEILKILNNGCKRLGIYCIE